MKKFILILFVFCCSGSALSQVIYPVIYPLRITDGTSVDTLYFGLDSNATNGIDIALGENELPPLPPDSQFDVRFTGNNLIPIVPIGNGLEKDYREYNESSSEVVHHKINFQWPITSTYMQLNWWDIPIEMTIRLRDLFGGILIDTSFNETGSYRINNPGITAVLFDITYQLPLPVELSSFIGEISGNNVTLKWKTNSESNNSGFEIQRKITDRQDWDYIGYVQGRINSSEITNYQFTDKNLAAGSYNYRLKQIDVNGNFEYFNLTETVQIGIPESFYVSQNYPNPFNPVTTINYNLPKASDLKIAIYDNQGKLVKVLQDGYSASGYFEISIDASDLTSGLYYCNFEYGNEVVSRKMIVLK